MTQTAAGNEKIRGAHVFGQLDSTNIQSLAALNLHWITLVPYGSQEDFDSPTMHYFPGDSLYNIQRDSMWRSQIGIAHAQGFKVFMKPHIWVYAPTEGTWRSDIFPKNDANWQLWKNSYRAFILLYARIAEQNDVELFCIGTELTRLSGEKSDFWRSLIQEVRQVYSGQITYAANWYLEYEQIAFWDALDYIGVQAYFPLADTEHPSVEQLSSAWADHIPALQTLSATYNRKILFTEMGYKSTADAAIEPWKWIEYDTPNQATASNQTQANCYQAFFDTVWEAEWFGGVHLWQLRSDFEAGRGMNHLDFTPQGKSAAEVIAKGFK